MPKFAIGVAVFAIVLIVMPIRGQEYVGPSARPTTPPEVTKGERLLAEHADECWQGDEKPLAELPGAAIVQFRNGRVIYTTRHDLVDEAFAEALASIGYGNRVSARLDPIALCI